MTDTKRDHEHSSEQRNNLGWRSEHEHDGLSRICNEKHRITMQRWRWTESEPDAEVKGRGGEERRAGRSREGGGR